MRSARYGFRLALPLTLLLAFAGVARAQPAHQVADLNTTQEDITDPLFTGGMGRLTVIGSTVFSLQDDGIHGVELWKSDGTAAGTVLVKDICPGGCSAQPRFLTAFGGALYFSADDGVHGQEIWRSDGTAAGTSMVADLNPGLKGSDPRFRAAGGILFVSADDGAHGRELFKTDGTAAGTQLVADIDPGAEGSDPGLRIDVSGRLLFAASDGVHGREPWLSDGTAAGTVMVADVNPGADDSLFNNPYYGLENDAFDLGGGEFLFQANSPANGIEPWISDGTSAGTSLLLDVEPGTGSSFTHGFARLGSKIFFIATQATTGIELWATDGTPGGTALFLDVAPGTENGWPIMLTPVGGRLFFAANDGTHGRELWATDGTLAGTAMVKDINPDPSNTLATWSISPFIVPVIQPFNGGLLLFADDGTHGAEVWKSDGTAAGTALVKDVDPGLGYGIYRGYAGIAVAGTTAYFQGINTSHGAELWKTDGTDAGTVEVKDVQTLASAFQTFGDYGAGNFRNLGGKLLCDAYDGGATGDEPWVSDGTAAGTVQLADLTPGPNSGAQTVVYPVGGTNLLVGQDGGLWTTDGTPGGTAQMVPRSTVQVSSSSLGPALGQIFFAGQDSSLDVELWKTDGTAAGTVKVADINPSGGSDPGAFTQMGSVVLFLARDASGGELWRTAGTGATTYALTSVSSFANIYPMTPLGSKAVFSAFVVGSGQELGVTDGNSSGGTTLLKDIRPGGLSSNPQILATLGSRAVFTADDGTHGIEIWATDGTAAGTVLLQDIFPGSTSSFGRTAVTLDRVKIGGTLFFVADDGTHGGELWKTDGTPAGTVQVADIYPGARSSDIDWMTAVGGRLFFVADDGVHGRELWVSDGTATGTRLVKDIVAGAGSPVIRNARAIDHLLLFSADDGVHGRELWRSDGGPAGTFLAQDIVPGAAPSNPIDFVAAGGNVFFTATDNVTGYEIWAAPKSELFVTFQDVPTTHWAWSYIEALAAAGITTGCAPGQYCVGSLVTRAEIAAFLERGLHGASFTPPPPTGTVFTDVPASYWAAAWIEQLFADGITTGCAPSQFCPGQQVNRAEMAVFLLRARHGGSYMPPVVAATRFTDVPAGYWAKDWIEQLAIEGITTGCAPNQYCPADPVGRDQMAAFLARTFGLPLP